MRVVLPSRDMSPVPCRGWGRGSRTWEPAAGAVMMCHRVCKESVLKVQCGAFEGRECMCESLE